MGSMMIKAVILNEGVVASNIGPTGPDRRRLANRVVEEAGREIVLKAEQNHTSLERRQRILEEVEIL